MVEKNEEMTKKEMLEFWQDQHKLFHYGDGQAEKLILMLKNDIISCLAENDPDNIDFDRIVDDLERIKILEAVVEMADDSAFQASQRINQIYDELAAHEIELFGIDML
jgi:hypothetical protein